MVRPSDCDDRGLALIAEGDAIARVGADVLNALVGELPDMSFARNFCCC
jgi:hypothetical protein